jgi:hypothetical protein
MPFKVLLWHKIFIEVLPSMTEALQELSSFEEDST